MPNWCENKLFLTVENDNNINCLERFVLENKNEEDDLSFECSVPQPENIYKGNIGSEEKKLYGKNNWYDWNCNNWGTKWDCTDVILEDNSNQVEYYFNTAWSPPIQWLEKTSIKYPNIIFSIEYSEGGCDFWGIEVYKNGELLENQYCSLVQHAWNLVGDNVLENININDYFPNCFDENDLNDIHSNDLINNFIEDITADNEYSYILENDIVDYIYEKMENKLNAIHKIKSFYIMVNLKKKKLRLKVKDILSNKVPECLANIISEFY